MGSGPVPVIDLAPGDTPDVARAVDQACRELGFLVVRNLGVEPQIIERCWQASMAFFDQPEAIKLAAHAATPGHPYGYHPFAAEALAQSLGEVTPPDLKETFNVGPLEHPRGLDAAAAAFAFRDNLWPPAPPGFREALEVYYRAMREASDRVMGIMARALGLPVDHFAPFFRQPMSALRVINYPAPASLPMPGQLRAGAHTDYGTLTLLLQQEERSGLQVLSRGEWHDVPALPGTFVVNIGDLMAQWTNDRWVSTLHRVVNPPQDAALRRQSLVFFHTPDWNAEIRCLPGCEDGGARHATVRAGPHLAAKFLKTVQ